MSMTPATTTPASLSFLMGDCATFTPEDFLPDEKLMIETAEQFSRKEILPILERLEVQEDGLMPSLIQKAGEIGFCGIDAQEAYGGLGLSKNLAARILEFLSLNGSFSVTIGVTSGISQVGLSLFGTPEQKEKYLPAILSGSQIGAYCLSEPNSGTDALSLSTRAERDGSDFILDGTKMWISNAKWASQFLTMAKVEGKVTAFLVERDFPGVSIAREEHKLGLKGSSTSRVILDNVRVPAENMVYREGKGATVAMNALNLGRFKLSSMSIGPAREALTVASQYALDRKQFGQPIAKFGLIEKKFAESAALFYAAESIIYRTGALIDGAFEAWKHRSDIGEIEQNIGAASEFAIECSMCKVFSTEAEAQIVDECFQVFGGYGFTHEFPIARIFCDARISKIYEGTNEINRFFIADRMLRRVDDGSLNPNQIEQSFIGTLLKEAIDKIRSENNPHQSALGVLADLAILFYAEQSSRLRAKKHSQFSSAANLARALLNQKSAACSQLLTGKSIAIPETQPFSISEIASAVYEKSGPLV